jgi:DNA-binding response OmpR family regulator
MSRSLRILLVEDHDDTQRMMSTMLRTFSHDVKAAGTVQAAMTLADAHQFDLVITDIGLPDGSGEQLMTALRQKYGLSGIALTGREEDRVDQSSFIAHLTKPVDFDVLERTIGRVMSG